VLGHCHCFVEVAGQGVRRVRIAGECGSHGRLPRSTTADPWPQRATDVQLQRPAAAGHVGGACRHAAVGP
jgi:hypothetical protein